MGGHLGIVPRAAALLDMGSRASLAERRSHRLDGPQDFPNLPLLRIRQMGAVRAWVDQQLQLVEPLCYLEDLGGTHPQLPPRIDLQVGERIRERRWFRDALLVL